MRRLTQFFLLGLLLFVFGCAPSYNREFRKAAKAKGWTEEQQEAALAESYVHFLNEKDGKLEINYAVLPKKQVREELDKMLKSFEQLLSFNEPEAVKYVDFFDLREALSREEKRLKLVHSRLLGAELQDKFQDLMGESSSMPHDAIHGFGEHGTDADGYDYEADPRESSYGGYQSPTNTQSEEAKKLKNGFSFRMFLPKELSELFKFSVDRIETAKERGLLKLIEKSGVFMDRKYDRKKQDLGSPDDPNKFVWQSRAVALEIYFYKVIDVDKPENNQPDYVEAYRVTDLKEGKREAKPCVRAFAKNFIFVVLIDKDAEGDQGYGLPDEVLELTGFATSNEVFSSRQLWNLVFKEKEEVNRTRPKEKEVFVEIAKLGKEINVWEDAKDEKGWLVPFKYRNSSGSNYNVKLKFKDRKGNNPDELKYSRIEAFAKEYTGSHRHEPAAGAAVEYFHPKPPYDGEFLKAEVLHAQDTKKLEFSYKSGKQETVVLVPDTSELIEAEPYAIEYTEGETRWHLEKRDGSKVFNKRKQVSNVKGKTGSYTD